VAETRNKHAVIKTSTTCFSLPEKIPCLNMVNHLTCKYEMTCRFSHDAEVIAKAKAALPHKPTGGPGAAPLSMPGGRGHEKPYFRPHGGRGKPSRGL
jgi:hypothetical protein